MAQTATLNYFIQTVSAHGHNAGHGNSHYLVSLRRDTDAAPDHHGSVVSPEPRTPGHLNPDTFPDSAHRPDATAADLDRGSFGNVLRRLRLHAQISQEQLAEPSRLSVESISALERGRRRAPYGETNRLDVKAVRNQPTRKPTSGVALGLRDGR